MMSVERSFEAWEEVQRHGLDLADKLAQGVTGLIQSHITPPSFPWPYSQNSKLFDVDFPTQSFIPRDFGIAVDKSAIAGVSAIFEMGNRIGQASKLFDVELPSQSFIPRDFGIPVDSSAIAGVSSIFEIGNRIGQAGADFGACLNGIVHQFFKKLPVPFRQDENLGLSLMAETDSQRADLSITLQEDLGLLAERFKGYGYAEKDSAEDKPSEEEFFGVNLKAFKHFGRSQGTINFSSTYESRTRNVESSVAARGDLWRVEASQGSSTSGNENSSLFLVQLGPILFVRDSTLLLPVHLSKQHLLWYGYDRKRGMHSLCPAVWSKHRRWLLMSMICLNPLACGFRKVDPEQWEFANEEFLRGQRHLLKNIYRRKPIHSHSATGQSVAPLTDLERQEYEDEIERLKKENSLLQSSAENQEKFNGEYEIGIKSMEQRLQNVAHRQGKLISLLAQLLQRPEFSSDIIQCANNNSKKRRLLVSNYLIEEENATSNSVVAPKLDVEMVKKLDSSINFWERFLYGIRMNPTEDQMHDFEHTQPLTSPIVIREMDTSSDDSGKRNSPIDHSPSHSRDIQSSSELGGGPSSPVISSIYVNLECQLKPSDQSNQVEGKTTKASELVSNSGNDVFWQQFLTETPGCTEPQQVENKEFNELTCDIRLTENHRYWWNRGVNVENLAERMGHLSSPATGS